MEDENRKVRPPGPIGRPPDILILTPLNINDLTYWMIWGTPILRNYNSNLLVRGDPPEGGYSGLE